MPYFSIQTNRPLDDDAVAELTKKASVFAANLLGKPESYVMTALKPVTAMTFAGSQAPTAFIEVRSIGLPEADCSAYAERISTFIHDETGIQPDRIFIEFTDLPRTRFAWNGKTFA